MFKQIFLLLIGLFFSLQVAADTLFITAKKTGHHQYQYFELPNVMDYGYNTAGSFMVRFTNGHEVSYGKRSHWERFDYTYVNDDEQLRKF